MYKNHKRAGHKRLFSFGSKTIDGYADFGDFKVYDRDVAKYVNEHLHFYDRFNIFKITEAVLLAFSILCGAIEPPKGKWYF
jgi:hypothetical protein